MVMYKSCARCGGDMHSNSDVYGEYQECLMCGYMIDIHKPSLIELPKPVAKKSTAKRSRRKTATKVAA
jgi:DNA-directed RNA polymerase subunit M/transcription elongation factor TFIIS